MENLSCKTPYFICNNLYSRSKNFFSKPQEKKTSSSIAYPYLLIFHSDIVLFTRLAFRCFVCREHNNTSNPHSQSQSQSDCFFKIYEGMIQMIYSKLFISFTNLLRILYTVPGCTTVVVVRVFLGL